MIADLKPYAQYKESGLPWLGPVPSHWETRPAFGAFVPNHDRNRGMKEKTVLSLSYGRIVIKPIDKLHGLVPESYETYQVVDSGDIVIRTTDLQNDHTSLRVAIVRDRGIITSAYLALRTSLGVTPEFGFQFLNVWDASKAIYGYGSGLRQNLDFSHFKRMPVAVPPPNEQAAIVRFLDWANGRLERAIRAKRKVIALLNEQKQAIIHRAVTRGLDPSVPLKPSGIPWLGDIPQHWEVRRLSAIAHFRSGKAHEQFVDSNGEHICVTARFVSTSGKSRKFCTKNFCPAVKGDVLMVMSDLPNGRALARAFVVRDDNRYAVNQRVCALTAHSIDSRFLAYWANRNWHLLQNDDGLNQTHLSNYDFKTMPVLMPPAEEQTQIADWLDRETSDSDITCDRLFRECELLSEYRTRLVADVVTGKLDVREAAARLTDEAPHETSEDNIELTDDAEIADEEAEA